MPERCPHCDAPLPPTDDAFCGQCREPLEEEREPAPESPKVVEPIKEPIAATPAKKQAIDLVTLAAYPNPQEASIARAVLAYVGIDAYLIGAETVNALWYVGTALGGVKLQVAQRDVDQASKTLRDIQSINNSESIGPWKCPSCDVRVDAGFEICWSCGAVADSQAAETAPDQEDEFSNASTPVAAADDSEHPAEVASLAADATALRAWRSAVFGIGLSPLLFYSFYLLLTLVGEELSPAGTRRFYGALVVLTVIFGLFWGIYQVLSGNYFT